MKYAVILTGRRSSAHSCDLTRQLNLTEPVDILCLPIRRLNCLGTTLFLKVKDQFFCPL